jgi:NAD(P)-dependent dehydrogenase (short-subunit alcohol dehydrogenase family)
VNWSEKRFLVTGGTHGIGRAIGKCLQTSGVTSLVIAAEEETPHEWEEFERSGALYVRADLETETEPFELVRRSAEL